MEEVNPPTPALGPATSGITKSCGAWGADAVTGCHDVTSRLSLNTKEEEEEEEAAAVVKHEGLCDVAAHTLFYCNIAKLLTTKRQ